MMMSNHLTPTQRASTRMMGQRIFAEGHGYGMGVAVVMEPAKADPPGLPAGRAPRARDPARAMNNR